MHTMAKEVKRVKIVDGLSMPIIGIGTWEICDGQIIHDVLDAAFATGYRLIDTANYYNNEILIGDCLKLLMPKHNLSRQDIFITSKSPFLQHGAQLTHDACLESLKHLQTDYLDLYLVHYPGVHGVDPSDGVRLKELRRETWLEMEKLKEEGKVKAIGVSNYLAKHLEELLEYASVQPAVNQCEFHPYNTYPDLLDYCRKHEIHFQAYSSLGSAHSNQALFKEPLVEKLSKKYKCQPAQLLLAWALNQDVSVIPKTTNVEHVKTNFQALDIHMEKSDLDSLGQLSTNVHYCLDPTPIA